tara:strand:+ start:5063 stop:5308 length:246 start_codon:yes stop_codon:yes gene_type:complete
MEYHNFVEALDEAMQFIAKEYPTSVWEGDVHDFYALLIKANFTNQVFMDYLKHAIDNKVYLPVNVKCVVDGDRISKVIIGG